MAKVLHHVTVVRDGLHNAFTCLAHWRGLYWVAYRKGDCHRASPLGEVAIAVSADRIRWREAARIKINGDCRDPRFVVVSPDRLALLFPLTPTQGADTGTHLQCLTFSDDGCRWEPPRRILEPRHHVFRVREHEGVFYGLDCYREGELRHLELWTSRDLLAWARVCEVGPRDLKMNESDIAFRPGGEAWIIARTKRNPDHAVFCAARPPYTQWEIVDLKRRIHAPALLEHHGRVYVAGRCNPLEEGEPAWPFGSSLAVWEVTHGGVTPVLRLPAVGDCSYPGLIKDPEGRVCLSYYSQHAYYLGVVPPFGAMVTPPPPGQPNAQGGYASDIYFAEIELP